MTLKDRLNENVTWQQIGITIGVITFSATLAIGALSAKVDRVDAKVDNTIQRSNDVLVKMASDVASVRASSDDMRDKVNEMYKSYIRQTASEKYPNSAITISNQN